MRRRHSQGGLGTQSTGKLFCVVLAVVFGVFCAAALSSAKPQPQSEAAKTQLERGRYLVQQVGICGDCHTPRDDKGQPVEEKLYRVPELCSSRQFQFRTGVSLLRPLPACPVSLTPRP